LRLDLTGGLAEQLGDPVIASRPGAQAAVGGDSSRFDAGVALDREQQMFEEEGNHWPRSAMMRF
jgi:hypothetical protein